MDPVDNTNFQPVESNPNNPKIENNPIGQKLEQPNIPDNREKPLTTSAPPTSQQQVQSQPPAQSVPQQNTSQQLPPQEPNKNTQANVLSTQADENKIDVTYTNRAEHIIAEHSNDPYSEEEAEESLSREFLRNKYGVNIDDPEGN